MFDSLIVVSLSSGDYDPPSPSHLSCSQRVSKLKLLAATLGMLLPDIKSKQQPVLLDMMCSILWLAARRDQAVKLDEQLAILQVGFLRYHPTLIRPKITADFVTFHLKGAISITNP